MLTLLRFFFGSIFWIWAIWCAFDTFYDVWLWWGWIGLVISLGVAPFTYVFFPAILAGFGFWGQAISIYLVLPVLWWLFRFFDAFYRAKVTA